MTAEQAPIHIAGPACVDRNMSGRLAEILQNWYPHLIGLTALIVMANECDILKVCYGWSQTKSQQSLPNMNLWLIVPAAHACSLVAMIPRRVQAGLLGGGLSALLAFLLAGAAPVLLWVSVLAPIAVLAAVVVRRRRGEATDLNIVGQASLFVALALGAQIRFMYMLYFLQQPLDPDVVSFTRIAETARGYATEVREPLFIWLYQLMHVFTRTYTDAAVRLFSVSISLATLCTVYAFARKHVGVLAAAIAAVVYAWRPLLSEIGVRGLREELTLIQFLAFASVYIDAWGKKPDLRQYTLMGIIGATTILVRLNSLLFIVAALALLFTWSVYRTKYPPRQWWIAALPIVVMIVPVLPYLAYSKKHYGDPFYFVSQSVPRFYANLEFVGTSSDIPKRYPADFPTEEQFAADFYAGPRISMGRYIFKFHTLGEIIGRWTEGAISMYVGTYARVWFAGGKRTEPPPAFYYVHLLGLAAMLLPGRRLLFMLVFLFHAPMFFLIGALPWTYGTKAFDPRLLMVAYGVYCIGIGAAAQTIWDFARKQMGAEPAEEERAQQRRPAAKPRRTRPKGA